MALQNQIFCYSIGTDFFYNEKEFKIHTNLNKLYKHRKKIKTILKKVTKKIEKKEKKNITKEDIQIKKKVKSHITKTNKRIKTLKLKIYAEFKKNKNIRNLNSDRLSNKNIVAIFESTLTRVMNINHNTLTNEIIIIQAYFFDIVEDIVEDGFYLNNEKYICLTASAGQIRTKKIVFAKENTLLRYINTLMCGMTIEIINKKGGVNINKYLAYLALCNSATDLWIDFDIKKTIVVDDMETNVNGLVDFINRDTYEITRKQMDIPITHTDGCGMILPSLSNKSFMVRLPWIKGLLVPFDFVKFIQKNKTNSKIKDIYGKEWDIINDEINIIFTKSQFKMYLYYKSWQDYTDKYLKYNCQAGKCNEEDNLINNAKINYQMLQTLVDMTDIELNKVANLTKNRINNICKDKNTMFKALGVTPYNKNKNYIQQAIEIYPNILRDSYSKNILKQTKDSIVKEGRSGRLDIEGKYTFICPDLFAFCEFLFMGNKAPKGLLKDGEVYCRIYKNKSKLDCLRSPHLYKEHVIRKNIIDDLKAEWFITGGLYTSCHDLISKILQFDNDGDQSLVVADETIISVAERNMKGIVPLYYKMEKAGVVEISNTMIFNGLKEAYTGGIIGIKSNDISKIWNSENIDLDAIKLLCMENNFTIDYAKTLYKLERPKHIDKFITNYTKAKVPHFFIYAKDKKIENVEKINNSVVNRLVNVINNPKFEFKLSGVGRFDYTTLDILQNTELNQDIIDLYEKLDLNKFSMMNNKKDHENYRYVYFDIRNQLLFLNSDIKYIVSVLVNYLYGVKKVKNKITLWECFGDIIIDNIKANIKEKYIYCEQCEVLVEKTSNKTKYCKKCAREMQKNAKLENWNKNKEKYRPAR